MARGLLRGAAALLAAAALSGARALAPIDPRDADAFVRAEAGGFVLRGQPFRFAGTNCYYVMYEDRAMVDDVFARAVAHNFTVLRTWAFLWGGFANGTGSIDGHGAKNGVLFRYFDPAVNGPVVNASSLAHLDYVLASAARHGVRLVLTLDNNWADFAGMDQSVRWLTWANSSYTDPRHDDYYSHPTIQGWSRDWARTLITRVNSITGVRYGDDPTIFSWELANEPRCQGTGAYPPSDECVTDYAKFGKWPQSARILPWAAAMSAYIKSLDSKHLVSVGDEGWACQSYQMCPDTTCDCYFGVDNYNMTALPTIDYGGAHLYPGNWGHEGTDGGLSWGLAWIANHTAQARALGKPFVLGEYGVRKEDQPAVYQAWGDALLSGGTAGDLFWMISGVEDDGGGDNGWYPDYDGLAVYCVNASEPAPPSGANPATCPVLAAHAAAMARAGASGA